METGENVWLELLTSQLYIKQERADFVQSWNLVLTEAVILRCCQCPQLPGLCSH